ncbi:sentrin-specific protease 7 isoform X2 [Sphaerodactylus townsendi]|uniref:sentrin-specific protease 7 isoform X2 n=1 Tax=Sphaerodactylus townsendi TaxID=933632 RepID=UPI002027253C|nr:sentrin-specific protease 7 isoform X2 [Sphaerodactylus townsendi]
MEGYGKNANPLKFRIPKKKANMQSDEIRIQSPLSRLTDAHHWDYPLKEWKLETRNNLYHTNCNRKRRCEKYHINDDATTLGQPKVMLTNVLKTEVGRKYIKTHPITDANLSHVVKLQSTQQTSSSADSIEIWQILSSPHQSLFISKRQPKVTLTNVLRTRTGRKYVQTHLLADANLSDASNLQSDEEPSSSVASLESCQKISSQQSCILSKRYGRFHRRSNDHLWKPCKDIESSSAVPTLRRCDVVLEDCSIQNKERECQDRRTKDSKNASPGLRETCFQNNECRKRRGEDFSSQRSVFSRRKSSLPSKEQSTEPVEPPGQERNPQQENILQSLELDCYETFTTANQDTAVTCPGESCSKISPKRKQHSVVSKDVQISPPVSSPKKQEGNTAVPSEEPGTILKKNKQMTESAEPIVVSSDEEESAEAKYTKLCLQTTKGHLPESKETEQGYVLPLSEELSQGLIENKTEQASTESPTLKATSNCMTSEQADFALDVKSAVVFIGKYKGTATGCIRFSTSYIKIPFEALNKNVDLLIDTRHFKKIGLWTDHKDSSTSRSDTVIFLWLSSNYVEQIENQIGTSVLNKNVKSTEFLFLKLSQSLTEGEQVILNKIILEISKKNSTPDLIDFFPWKQAVLLLQDISAEECSFFDDCNMLLQELKKSTTVLEELQPQESKLSPTKPSYCLLQKQSGGKYSFSISSAKEDEWKEFQDTRPVQCLMVYPPPPAKGGLGVTREDLECLDYGEFLNDVIIDFYLKYLLLEKAPRKLAERSHIFSSFFYKCLTRTKQNSEENPNLSLAQRRHKRVKRWTRHTNIFNKDYIFVPVNEESHWYIAIICFPWLEEVVYEDCLDPCSLQSPTPQFPVHLETKTETVRTETVLVFSDNRNDEEMDMNSHLQLNDNGQPERLSPASGSISSKSSSGSSKIKKLCKRPCILILDSLKASSIQNTVQVLREYLELEWEVKLKTCREFSKSTMVDFCPRVPKQNNNSDCGVYLLQYVETFFQSPIVNFEVPLHLDRWFPRQAVRNKREEIRDLILQLHLQQQRGSKS